MWYVTQSHTMPVVNCKGTLTGTLLLILLCAVHVSSYLQFVVPGNTTANMSSTYIDFEVYNASFEASNAVDGSFSQRISNCSHTADSGVTEAWLAVDLQTVRSVKSVKFWYRNDRTSKVMNTIRLREFFILFSNVSTLSEARVCYSQPPGIIDTTILEKDCQSTARYIWFYQNKTFEGPGPMLEICEVQVFGCETGFYGENCSSTCDHCKNTETCGIVTGHCDEQGCALSGFQAPKCTECSPGFYGADCDKVCSQTCKLDNSCIRTTGFCLHGCDIGYIGDYCNSTCSSGTYGQDCNETCRNCLNNMTCNHFNGTCPSGCNAGFEGHICKSPCSSGTYGQNCNEPCGNCLNNMTCNRYNGTCPSGCNAGFEGHICKTPCSSGTYGQNCNEPCGNCLNNTTCNRFNGTCPSGCNAGFEGHICKTPCNNRTFGRNCVHQCGHCLNGDPCNKTDGTCQKCTAGWGGELCNIALKQEQSVELIVGSSAGVLVFVASVAVAVILIRKSRKRKDTSKTEDKTNTSDLTNVNQERNGIRPRL